MNNINSNIDLANYLQAKHGGSVELCSHRVVVWIDQYGKRWHIRYTNDGHVNKRQPCNVSVDGIVYVTNRSVEPEYEVY